MRRWLALAVLAIVATLVFLAGASPIKNAIHDRAVFGTFDTSGPPPRVDYCGRRYYPGSKTESLADVEGFLAKNHLQGLTRIDTAPSGMPILANVMSPSLRAHYRTNACTMALWVQTGADAYTGYSLSGGP